MRLIGALAIVMGLVTGASAEDWSQFIDNSPQKPLIATHPEPTTVAAAPKAHTQRPAAKSVAAKPKAKARPVARRRK